MPTTIDNRVVEMKFDNKQFEKGASQTINTLGNLNKSLLLENAQKGFAGVAQAASKVDVSSISAGLRDINWALLAVMTAAQTVFRRITDSAINAGIKIGKALTIDGAIAGFNEYEQKMNAIQTMMASTGENLATVNKYLQELNEYSDQTIYSFSDMTQNIGKFTNAGVKLPRAVAAIKGIANSAALSGASTENAAAAMYNLGQALGKGYVADIDWRSIEFANMATVEFKDQIIKAAIAAGTLEETSNGMYKAIGKNGQGRAMKNSVSAAQLFADNLQYQWFTADILTKTLNNYADITTDIGRRATAAATNIKTFSQMMGTIRESIQSGWAMSAEYIFGDLEEAKKLWTGVALGIGEIIGPIEESRNEMLKLWKDFGGRAAVIEGLKNIFESLSLVLGTVGSAFREVFPAMKASDLINWSKDFLEFTKKLKPSTETLITIRKVLVGVFSAFELVFKSLKFIGNVVITFISSIFGASEIIDDLGGSLKDLAVNIADFFTNLNETADKSEIFEKTLKNIKDSLKNAIPEIEKYVKGLFASLSFNPLDINMDGASENITETFDKIKSSVQSALVWIGKGLELFKQVVENVFGNFGNVLKVAFAGGGLALFGKFVFGILKFLNQGPTGFSDVMNSITDSLDSLQKRLNAETLKSVATSLLILAAAMVVMSMIPAEKLEPVVVAMSLMIMQVVLIMKSFDTMDGGVKGITKAAFALNLIATALLIMASALKSLSSIKSENLITSIEAVGALLLIFAGFGKLISEGNSGIVQAGFALMLLAGGLAILGGAFKIFATMELDQLKQGIVSVGELLLIFAVFSRAVDPKGMAEAGLGLIGIAAAMLILGGVIKLLGTMKTEDLGVGMMAIASTLILMGFAINMFPTDAVARAAGVVVMAAAIMIIAKALKTIGDLSLEQVGIALLGLFGALAMMTGVMTILSSPTSLAGVVGIILMAGAFLILANAMKVMSGLSWADVGKGLAVLAGAIVIIGVAGYVLTSVSIGLLAFGAAVLLLGMGVALAGAGILAFGAGLTALAAIAGTAGSVILNFIKEAATLLPTIFYNLGKSVVSFFMGIFESWGEMSVTILKLVNMVIDLLIQALPKVFELFEGLLDGILKVIWEYVPKIAIVFLNLLMGLLTAIEHFLPKIIDKAGNIVVSFINGMSRYYNKIINAGTNFIINLIKGIARNMLKIVNAAAETILAFINGLTTAVNKYAPKINAAMRGLIAALFRAALDAMGLYTFADIGKRLMDGITTGINNAVSGPLKAIKGVIDAIIAAAKKAGIIKSPSRRSANEVGAPIVLGIAAGMTKNTREVMSVATNVVSSVYSAMSRAVGQSVDLFSNITDPKITPVVDLSNVYRSAASISSLLGSRAMGLSASVNSSIGQNGSGSVTTGGSVTDIKLIQNNYSPKELSRLEIYRQTDIQMMRLKGLVRG